MRPHARVRVEPLETRETPATFGTPWPDGSHLTLSFAPDGTAVSGRPSDLGAVFAALGPAARLDVLRAFQSWAAAAGVNIGLVGDTGQPFGTGGATQGDPRFGDLRVGGRAIGRDVLAVTAPYGHYDNHSGDVVLNTAQKFSLGGTGGADLFTVFLQEAGHALGIGNSSDPASAMYEYYQGPRAGLSAGDAAAAQALYGPRVLDGYEGSSGNDSLKAAAGYLGPLEAELTTPADVDVYRFVAGLLNTGTRVSLKAAGLSLATGRVELLDSAGRVVAAGYSTDPTANDVTITAGRLNPLATYYVRVSAARSDVFGVGAYRLEVDESSVLGGTIDLLGALVDETGLNDTLTSATQLVTDVAVIGPRTEYHARGGFGSAQDIDYYRIDVPPSLDGKPVTLLTTIWGRDAAVLNPWVGVTDAFGARLACAVVTANGNTTTLQVRGLLPGHSYFLRVSSDTGARGAYELAADLRAAPVPFDLITGGTLSADRPSESAVLRLAQSGQVHLMLQAADGDARLSVRDGAGREVARLATPAGRGRSLDVFLPAGDYRLEVVNPTPAAPVRYRLAAGIVTDPVGVRESDTSGTPSDQGTGNSTPPSGGDTTATQPSSGTQINHTGDDPYWY